MLKKYFTVFSTVLDLATKLGSKGFRGLYSMLKKVLFGFYYCPRSSDQARFKGLFGARNLKKWQR